MGQTRVHEAHAGMQPDQRCALASLAQCMNSERVEQRAVGLLRRADGLSSEMTRTRPCTPRTVPASRRFCLARATLIGNEIRVVLDADSRELLD
jgi:hypothetical protein